MCGIVSDRTQPSSTAGTYTARILAPNGRYVSGDVQLTSDDMGMRHDGEENDCKALSGSIMAPRIQGNGGVFKWSVCSRSYLQEFLGFVT